MANIKQINLGGTNYSIVGRLFYGTCSTSEATNPKAVTCADFSASDLVAGTCIIVKNTTAATALNTSTLQLNVQSTGAKYIRKYQNGSTVALDASSEFGATIMMFIYDGTNWVLQGNYSGAASDTLVTQTITTTNATYPLLFSGTASKSATSDDTARFDTNFYYNPSLNKLFIGTGTNGGAFVLGTTTSAGLAGWTTTVPSSTSNAVQGQVCFVVVD